MTNALYIYRSMDFDGKIHIKIVGKTKFASASCKLLRNGLPYAHLSLRGDTGVFRYIPKGTYHSSADVTLVDGRRVTLTSPEISITKDAIRKMDHAVAVSLPPDQEVRLYENVDSYFLDVSLPEAHAHQLREDLHAILMSVCHIEAFSMESDETEQHSVVADADAATHLFRIKAHIPTNKLGDVAARINHLDYVAYCVVTPDTTNMAPPLLPDDASYQAEQATEEDTPADVIADITPDFSHKQGYLDSGLGMNIRAVWARGITGKGATVRHLDFGIYRNHEDLQGDVTVVNSRRETQDCNHGTASTGCVVATENNAGVTGVAHGCRFFFYEIDDLNRIVRDAAPGDIVALDIHFGGRGTWLPALDLYSWWVNIKALTEKGAIVVMAAGNGGNFIGAGSRRMRDYGDSGGILVGCCYAYDGSRLSYSNYGHRFNLINSWGNAVVTTGYGDLQRRPGNNRNYAEHYGGTSSATPLCAAAMALIQSYAIVKHGVFLNAREMTDLITRTGYVEGLKDGIGHRPNVDKAIEHLANQLG